MIPKQIQIRTGLPARAIDQVLQLLSEGATVPFIARYRKERTGSLDEVQIAHIQQELESLTKLEKRKETILAAIDEQGKLTPELAKKIKGCWSNISLEDIYLPYKKSRKTKADTAREQGLEPLAKIISAQRSSNLYSEASRYVKGDVKDVDKALEGARYIIAAWMNENIAMRSTIRTMYERWALISSKVVKKQKEKAENYKDYFEFAEPLKKCPSHRLLAIYRGEDEGLLRVKINIDEDRAHDQLGRYYVKSRGDCAEQLDLAIGDALKRLILPSIENEFRKASKKKADEEAIEVFVNNLRQLLLAAPLGDKSVLAIDPGFRTGCKVVIIDEHGQLVLNDTIYPHPPQSSKQETEHKVQTWIQRYDLKYIAIGNGTAGRETYQFLRKLNLDVELYMVNESGASIYSASAVAREEFPSLDLTVRGAISIGRRLMDPLAELVKIDAKSIGVGQYQHDVNQTQLKDSLDRTVVSCVNTVGVNLNTASRHLLQYVSGVGPTLADNIIKHRQDIDGFSKRNELLKVARMGQKAYEQAAGFLRIKEGVQPLDNTGVHPERYSLVKKMLRDHGVSLDQLESQKEKIEKIDIRQYVSDEVGLPTLKDIIAELLKPGLDARGSAQPVMFSSEIKSISDLKVGMTLTGVVNNLTKFGAFVDLGIKESALLHISQITDRFIKDPSEILSLQQQVSVKILDFDVVRKRVSLTMKF